MGRYCELAERSRRRVRRELRMGLQMSAALRRFWKRRLVMTIEWFASVGLCRLVDRLDDMIYRQSVIRV